MPSGKWQLAAGHHRLFHIVAPIVARARGYSVDEGARDCDFFCTGSDARHRRREGNRQATRRFQHQRNSGDPVCKGGGRFCKPSLRRGVRIGRTRPGYSGMRSGRAGLSMRQNLGLKLHRDKRSSLSEKIHHAMNESFWVSRIGVPGRGKNDEAEIF